MSVSLGVLCTLWGDHDVTEFVAAGVDESVCLQIGKELRLTRTSAMVLRRLLTRWIDEIDVAAARARNAEREKEE